MDYSKVGCVAMLLMMLAAPVQADYGTGESASFTLDLLSMPPSGTVGDWSDSSGFSLDLRNINRDSADSASFFFGDNPNPAPIAVTIEVPAAAAPGQPFDLRVVLRNNGGPGDHGGVSISFPDLADTDAAMPPYESALADVAVHPETTFAAVGFADAGDTIYYEGNPIIAQHLLVEGDEDAWDYSEEHTLKLTVTPHQIGELTICIRLWVAGPGSTYGPPVYRWPEQTGPDNELDQQGYWSREICVSIAYADSVPGSVEYVGATELHDTGISGTGVKVGMLERALPWIDHAALAGRMADGENDPDPQDGDQKHATQVASVIVGSDAAADVNDQAYRGMATSSFLYPETVPDWFGSLFISAALQNLVDAGCDVINYSGGVGSNNVVVPDIEEKVNRIVDEDNVCIVASVGNTSQGYSVPVSPAQAYNTIAVGTTGDDDVLGIEGEKYDLLSVESVTGPTESIYNPDGRCKPDIVAAGRSWVATLSGIPPDVLPHGYDLAGPGTSIASPHVAGGIALLIAASRQAEASGESLSFVNPYGVVDPRAVKSALLTGADKDVLALDGGDQSGPTRPWQTTGTQQPLDFSLGAGGLDVAEAKQVLLGESSSDPQGNTILRETQFDVIHWEVGGTGVVTWMLGDITEPSQFTATLAWNAHYDGGLVAVELNNLDLYLMRDGVEVTRSDSSIDNVEHIHTQLNQPGNYSLEIRYIDQQTSAADPEPFGISYRLVPGDFYLPIPGDMDCNGVIEMADVPPFVEALLDPSGFDAAHPNCDSMQADVDGSATVDGYDVQGFVDLQAGMK